VELVVWYHFHSGASGVDKAAADHTRQVPSQGADGGCSVLLKDFERSHCTPQPLIPAPKFKGKTSSVATTPPVLLTLKKS